MIQPTLVYVKYVYIYIPSSFFKPTLDYNSNHKIFNFVTNTHVHDDLLHIS